MIIVTSEPKRKLVRAFMRGLLSIEEVEQFSRDEQAAVRSMGLGSGEFVLIIDALGGQTQTQEVMAAFHALLLNTPMKARKVATVRHGTLDRMQSRRISEARATAQVFDNLADAEAWLATP